MAHILMMHGRDIGEIQVRLGHNIAHIVEIVIKQAGAELGQAQLKLELNLTLTVCRFGLYRFGLIVIIGLILFCRFD